MSRNLAQIDEIQRRIELIAGAEVAAQVMAGRDQLKESTKPPKIAAFVQAAMARLDALTDEATRAQIMGACGQNCAQMNQTPIHRAVARRWTHPTLEAFLAAEQQSPPAGTRLLRAGDVLYQFYTPREYGHPMRCYCGLMRGLPDDQTASPTYCQCSRAFVQVYWEAVIGTPVRVELLESAVSGATECKFAVYLPAGA